MSIAEIEAKYQVFDDDPILYEALRRNGATQVPQPKVAKDDPHGLHNILHGLRSGEIEFLCEFSEDDYDAMESERIGEYEVRAL